MNYLVASREAGDNISPLKVEKRFGDLSSASEYKLKKTDAYNNLVREREKYANDYVHTRGIGALKIYLGDMRPLGFDKEVYMKKIIAENLLSSYNNSPKDFIPPKAAKKIDYYIVECPDE